MKNSRIVRAYDSINPSTAEKERMLNAILQEAHLEEKPVRQRKKKEPVVYTARPTKLSKRSTIMTIAASIVILLISGFVLTHVLRQPESISYNEPVNLGTPYDAVLTKYKTALEEGWSAERCNTEDIFEVTVINYSALDVGYTIVDLDDNGIEEMILSNGESQVYELYSINENGDPVQLYRKGPGFSVLRIHEGGTLVSESFENSGRVYAYYVLNGCNALTDPDGRMWQENGRWYLERVGEDGHVLTDEVAENTLAEQKYMKLDQTSLLTLVSEAVAEKYRYGDNNKYAAIIAKYNQAIAEGWTKKECEIEGISMRMEAGGDFTKAGYAFQDLDGDGREELIIAEESVPHIDNIWDIYTTLEDGTPIQLWVDERDGGQCRLHEGNVISISDSYQDELEQTFYDLQDGKLVMREMLQWENEDTVFHTDAEGNTRQVSSKEGQAISNAYDIQKLKLTWLAATTNDLPDTEVAEVYAPILEKYKTAILEGWSAHRCEENDISPQIFEGLAGYQDLGWCLLDIDKNGVEELIISDGVYLYDLYVMMPHDGSPGHVVCANGGETYQLCENGVIQKHGLYAGTTAWRYYTLQNIDLVLRDMVFYEGATNQYSYGTNDNDLQSISKEKVGEILFKDPTAELSLTPFVERPAFWHDEAEYYEPLLNIYRQAIREDWDPGICMENGISLMVGNYGDFVEELGYATMDLDRNGVSELIITDGMMIYDLYTLKDGSPVHLITGWERNSYQLCLDNIIYNRGSNGAASSVNNYYQLRDGELVLVESVVFDANRDFDNPWFRSSDGETPEEPLTEDAANAIMDSHPYISILAISLLEKE